MVPPPARQQFKDHVFAQFIRFVMLHDAQVGVHTGQEFSPFFF
jgi:protein-disulfide isomerase-like protein with CxxC motif